jgi:uncharacterized delta-60 repeat protein
MKIRHVLCLTVPFAAIVTASPGAHAQEGSYDPSWNGSGRRLVDFSSESDILSGMFVTPDNQVVVAGSCGPEFLDGQPCVARLDSGGALDAEFGLSSTGILRLEEFADVQPSLFAGIARGNDGALWLSGTTVTGSKASVARFAEDGKTLLGTQVFHFSNLPATPNSRVQAVAVAPGNAIVVAGTMRRDNVGNRGVAVARLLADPDSGEIALDPTFGNNGVVVIPYGREVTDVLVLPDGRILIAGLATGSASLAPGFVMRLLANGVIDDPFGSTAGGRTQLPLCAGSYGGYAPRLAIDTRGRIATAYTGTYRAADLTELDSEICVNRLLKDGRQDPAFGGFNGPSRIPGPVRVNIGGTQFLDSIVVGGDDKIIVGGTFIGSGHGCPLVCFMIARLNKTPRNTTVLDLSFGGGGGSAGQYDGDSDSESAFAIAIGNGGLMVAGSSQHAYSEPYTAPRFGVAKVQLGIAAFDGPIFADGFDSIESP